MMPFIGSVSTSIYLFTLACLIAFVTVFVRFGRSVGPLKLLGLIFGVAAAALYGSRIFHVLWERPAYFAEHPWEALTRFDGLVFYGAFGGGLLAFIWLSRRLFTNPRDYRDAWDLGAIILSLSVGILRTACFAEGCCWGAPTALPWSVRYFHPKTMMPWIGIPVHPVQLYDATLGFAMALLFAFVYRTGRPEAMRGRLVYFFGIGYGFGRFFTEFFRGDTFRGVDVAFSLSTSQLLSVVLVAVSGSLLYRSLARSLEKEAHVSRKTAEVPV